MALLKFTPMAYIEYFALNAPMLLAAFTLMTSAFNQNLKGLIFIMGGVILMTIGKFISSSLGRKVPNEINQMACNLFNSSNWGKIYSAPAPDALFLSYAFTYITAGMFFHSNYNWPLLGMLIIVLLTNASFRLYSLFCGKSIDILIGWSFGLIWALGWYFLMVLLENKYNNQISLTYFNNINGVDQCKLTKKKFKCKKISK
jgi:hypothetical protein